MYGQMPASPAPRPGDGAYGPGPGGPSGPGGGVPGPGGGRGATAGIIAVRVLVTAVAVASLGLLAWVAMLRLAIMRRTVLDWVLFWAQLAATVGCLVLLQEKPDSWQVNVGAAVDIAMAVAVVWHYLAADIRHHRAAAPGPYLPPHTHAPVPAYGYPPVNPATAATLPSGNPYAAQVPPPHPYDSAPTPPPSPRIDQVRAELDELSDLLRKEEGK
ncbi:DUF3824 domain-containing protein [Streptomyces filamentosus]|uniref:DUF3824 domain-containing protein n=1 Tax=Streptomyces filamentosus TaxID=67294 RepID=UPI0036E499D0